MKTIRLLALSAFALLALHGCKETTGSRVVEDFNFDWKFTLGDSPEFNFTEAELVDYQKQMDAAWEVELKKQMERQRQQAASRPRRPGMPAMPPRVPQRPADPHATHFTQDAAAQWAAPDFDDASWRPLHLPHDWAIEGQFSADAPSGTGGGALPGGIGWYRKHFTTPEAVGEGRLCYVEFDGIFMNSTVYVNGKPVGTRPYGYSSFSYDITSFLNAPGSDNVIAVRCDNADQPNSRWYAGCGIYRNVRLVTVDDAHVAYNGVYVTTPAISADKASVHVQAEIEGKPGTGVNFKIVDAKGSKVAFANGTDAGNGIWTADLEIAKPHLWDIDDTYQYSVIAYVVSDKEVNDAYTQKFGVRTIAWDADKGFFLNGKPLKFLGVCLHHDMGCIGSAVHFRALQRELQILKEMGVNAIRTSHNPPTPELLALADDMGFVVMDEAFDMWRKRKTTFDYSRFFDEWHVRDLQDFVKRDRNHPSIIMWSLANEIGEQGNSREDDLSNLTVEEANFLLNFMDSIREEGDADENNPNILLTRHMARLVREMDDTRFVSAGCNSPRNNLFQSGALDAYGFNYHPQGYDQYREWYPGVPLFGSETVSSINSRGIYHQPSTKISVQPDRFFNNVESEDHQLTAYDASRVPWGNLHEEAWIAVRDRDFISGTFIWTGFDYIGEPTPYGWPSRSSYFGIVDLAGFPKDPYYMYQSEWTDKTVLHLLPHWNWTEGEPIDVWAYYNNADEVELFVNGKSLGLQSKTKEVLHVQWLGVPFEAGKIEVVSYKDGKEVAREARYTAGKPVGLKVTPDRQTISADGYDLSYVTIEAVDANGVPVPTATDMLHFKVDGEGELFGIDNGNAADTYCMKGSEKPLFSGKALAVIRSIKGQPGTATLTVSSDYATVKTNIKTK